MSEIISNTSSVVLEIYSSFVHALPLWLQNFLNLFLLSLVVVIYGIFIWNFYRWIAKKDLLELNLRKYSRREHPGMEKFLAGILYFVEYLVILPIIVFIWFSLFTLFLMFLTENLELQTILIVSVTIITAIRMSSYYKEDLARDLAKMIPLTLLAVAITTGNFNFSKVLLHFSSIPEFLTQIWIYLIFIIVIEFVLRLMDVIFIALHLYEEESVKSSN